MATIPPFRARALNRRTSPLRRWLRRLRNRLVNSHTVRLLELGDYRCKQISFHDSWLAERAAASLLALRGTKMCPELLAHFEHQLYVEWVEGEVVDVFAERHLPALVEFFAALYAVEGEARPTATLPIASALQVDLGFLRNVGVIDDDCAQDLAQALVALEPPQLRVGYEYTDPLPRNFVEQASGALIAIDVESLERDVVQGTGLAKVMARLDEPLRAELLAQLDDAGHHALVRALPFIELAFLAEWMKFAFLKGRGKIVDPSRFERFRRAGAPDS